MSYTEKEALELCSNARKNIILAVINMIEDLDQDVSGECVFINDLNEGINEIKLDNGID